MNIGALSLEQTPRLSVPLPFFLVAPLFGAVAGLLLAFLGTDAFANRWTPGTLALTHLVTLGFLALAMVGAVQQLLPVLIGAPVPLPRLVAALLFAILVPGTALLAAGFMSSAAVLLTGAVLLAAGLLLFAAVAAFCLARARSGHFTVRAMQLAIAGLVATVLFGLHLASGHAGVTPLLRQFTDVHLALGLVGWVALLVIGVAYQVVPLFQITPDYPRPLLRMLAPVTFAALAVWAGARLVPGVPAGVGLVAAVVVAAGLAGFALATLHLQRRRKRRLPDVTLDFWRLAMGCLLLAVPAWGWGHLGGRFPELAIGVLVVAGFAVSAVNGMLYKIVPFLIWLHLNNRVQAAGRWQGSVPNMKKVIPEWAMRWQFRTHVIAVAALMVASLWPAVSAAAGLLFAAAQLFLAANLARGAGLYRRTVRALENLP